MDILTVLLIAFGLAMDAFAVSVASGVTIKTSHLNHALRIGIFFGLFQAVMPLIGWFAGMGLAGFISGFDHWIAFGLLTFIGVKMIYESTKIKARQKEANIVSTYFLLILSVATSIDALAVGVSLSFLKVSIFMPAAVIGLVTFFLSFAGVFIGNKLGHFFESKIEAAGGLVLIAIGIKILLEHLG